jgi:Bifunctional DNA primase/polymerase, N-terminal
VSGVPFDRANIYRIRGWLGTLPLPPRRKKTPPEGWTGHGAPYPTDDDLRSFRTNPETPIGNLALRLPSSAVGIDVDNYGDKPGASTLAAREAQWGPLPATYISTSRDDGISGIRFYRVPAGLKWPGEAGPGIETIHAGHRYAVVWPSVHDETGRLYQWHTPDGRVAAVPPRVTDLPSLPDAWVMGLTGGVLQADQPQIPAAGLETVRDYLATAPAGLPCRFVQRLVGRIALELTSGGSRHEAINGKMMLLVRAADWGHAGVPTAVQSVRRLFFAIANDRAPGEAEAEFTRSVAGAVAKVLASPARRQGKGCCGGGP